MQEEDGSSGSDGKWATGGLCFSDASLAHDYMREQADRGIVHPCAWMDICQTVGVNAEPCQGMRLAEELGPNTHVTAAGIATDIYATASGKGTVTLYSTGLEQRQLTSFKAVPSGSQGKVVALHVMDNDYPNLINVAVIIQQGTQATMVAIWRIAISHACEGEEREESLQ